MATYEGLQAKVQSLTDQLNAAKTELATYVNDPDRVRIRSIRERLIALKGNSARFWWIDASGVPYMDNTTQGIYLAEEKQIAKWNIEQKALEDKVASLTSDLKAAKQDLVNYQNSPAFSAVEVATKALEVQSMSKRNIVIIIAVTLILLFMLIYFLKK